MDVTLVLALLGTISGLTAATLSVLTYRANRPRILVKSSTLMDSKNEEFVVVDVRNEGQHGIEIVSVGLAVCPVQSGFLGSIVDRIPVLRRRSTVRRIDRRGVRYNEFAVEIMDDGSEEDEQVFLEPGRHFAIHIPMPDAAARQHKGMQSWPFAEDIAGRTFLARHPAHVQAR